MIRLTRESEELAVIEPAKSEVLCLADSAYKQGGGAALAMRGASDDRSAVEGEWQIFYLTEAR